MSPNDTMPVYVEPDSRFKYLVYFGVVLIPVLPFLPPEHQLSAFAVVNILLAIGMSGDIYRLRQQGVRWRTRVYIEVAMVLFIPLIALIYPWERRDQILRSRRAGTLTAPKSDAEN